MGGLNNEGPLTIAFISNSDSEGRGLLVRGGGFNRAFTISENTFKYASLTSMSSQG